MSQPPETRASAVDVDGGTPETNTDDGTPETISNDGTPQTPPLPPTKQPHLQPVRQRHSHSVGGNRLSAASSLQHAHQSPIAVTTPRLIQHMEEYALVEVNQLTKIVVYPGGDEDPGGHGGDRASWNKAEILSPQAARASASGGNSGSRENVSSFQRRTGLTSEQATRKLLEQARGILDQHVQNMNRKPPSYLQLLRRVESILTILVVAGLVGFYVYIHAHPDLKLTWIYPHSLIVEAAVLGALFLGSIWLTHREEQYTRGEVVKRARDIINRLESSGLNMMQELRVPRSNSTTIARVIRDGVIRAFPFSLLVEGDTVEMTFGDVAPCRMRYVFTIPGVRDDGIDRTESYEMEGGQVFRPALFGEQPSTLMQREFDINRGLFQFELLDTPVKETLRASLENRRPPTVLAQQAAVVRRVIGWTTIMLVVLSLLLSVARFVLSGAESTTWFAFLVVLQLYMVIPFLPFAGIIMWTLVRAFGNAKVLTLFEQLQQSTTPFDDREDVDEFDEEAAPPTKDVQLATGALLKKFVSLMWHEKQWMLTHSTNLLESLSSTTVICSVDRLGSIACPFPSVEELFFFTVDNEELVALDVTQGVNAHDGPKFEDKDWRQYLLSLKPFGLGLLLNTNCGVSILRQRSDHHRKKNDVALYCRCKPARETCLCALAKEMGFSEAVVQSYKKVKEFYIFSSQGSALDPSVRDDQFEIPNAVASLMEDTTNGGYVLFTEGTIDLLMACSSDYWDGADIRPLDEAIRKKIHDIHQNAVTNDLQCVLYSYAPVLPSKELTELLSAYAGPIYFELDREPPAKSRTRAFLKELLCGQVFLAMAALAHQPKEDVCDFIEDLTLAGIRFVYFSETAERESKAFAERLGIETDWNSSILLSSDRDPNAVKGYSEAHDIKAKLPRGIENIRPHLAHIDDIPLHVSLFADCEMDAVAEMIKIFQEYGEVVCCTGSAIRHSNTAAFALADVSVAIEPFHMKIHKPSKTGEHVPPFLLGGSLVSLPASLTMHYEASPYVLTQIIREARYFMNHLTQVFTFALGACGAIGLLQLLSYVFLLPPVMVGFHMLWLICIIIPLLSLPFLYSPLEQPDVMKLMPGKNKDHLHDVWRYIGFFFARFGPAVAMTLVVYILSLVIYYPKPWPQTIPALGTLQWLEPNTEAQWAVIYAQSTALFTFVLYLVTIAGTVMFRTLYVWEFSPMKNLLLLLQAGFSALFLLGGPFPLASLSWIIAVALVWPAVLVGVQEAVKRKDKKEFTRFQKRSKLEFNTKLGCYSPV